MLLECMCAKLLAALVGGGTVGAVAASDAKKQRRSERDDRDREASDRGDGYHSDEERYRAMNNYYSG